MTTALRVEHRLTGPYTAGTVCGLLAAAYAFRGIPIDLSMSMFLFLLPWLLVSAWLAADAKRTHTWAVHDVGLLFYLTWPFTMPWYAVHTRGRGGAWHLAWRLYLTALAPLLGLLIGGIGRIVTHG